MKGIKGAATSVPQGFADLLITIHSACASSASIERVFSTLGMVQSKLRNRFGVAQAAKLVFAYRMLRGTHVMHY